MNFENAKKGIKKIYNYEVIQIIIALLVLLITVVGVVAADDLNKNDVGVGTVGAALVILLAGLAVVVLAIIGVIILIKGLALASKDEKTYFRDALWSAVIMLICSVLTGLTSVVKFLADHKDIINSVYNINTIIMFVCIVFGIRTIAKQLGRNDVVSLSIPIIIIIVITQVCSIAGNFTGDVFSIIAAVAALVGYIVYLVFLSKAKDMFK